MVETDGKLRLREATMSEGNALVRATVLPPAGGRIVPSAHAIHRQG
jgi:hypothetical protein